MDPSTAILMVKALDGLNARSVATAENIANASSKNYRPMRVSFETALKEAAAQGDTAVQALVPSAEQAVAGTPEAELRLDLEMSTASGTAQRYGALVTLLNRQLQLDSIALQGDK
ncbi:MAG TPA: hypothetical protein VG889_09615 [Rhizomicrobium sp.]|nr:hypothetical protein [Rhizomicrobium sp.]